MNSHLEEGKLDLQSKGEFLVNPSQDVWRVSIAGQSKEFNKTVALVGAAPLCDVVLSPTRAPWIAGALIRTTNTVEFIPTDENTAHLACCLLPGGSLSCCGDKITVLFTAKPHENRLWPVVVILASNRIAKILLNQPAATLGSGFPSSIRVPSNTLQACNLILIPEPEKLLIYALPRPGRNLLHHLELHVGQKLTFKDVRIALLEIESPPLEIESPPQVLRQEISSQGDVHAGTVVFEAERYNAHLAVKVRDVFQSRELVRTRWRKTILLFTGLIITLTAFYFAWQLFKNLQPFL